MPSQALPKGIIALLLAFSALARLVPDLPPKTSMYQLPERRAAPTATTTLEPPASSLESDPWWCIVENVTQYFVDVPKPTGDVLDAIGSYGDVMAKPCMATNSNWISCTISDPKSWCGFTTFAAPGVLSSYSTYVSAAVSFLRAKSETMSILSTSCPVAWAKPEPGQREYLKIAMAHGQCYLQAHPITDTTGSGLPSSTTPTKPATSVDSSVAPPTATTKTGKGTVSRGQAMGAFAMLGMGLAVLLIAV